MPALSCARNVPIGQQLEFVRSARGRPALERGDPRNLGFFRGRMGRSKASVSGQELTKIKNCQAVDAQRLPA
jgi:hypothetical protein